VLLVAACGKKGNPLPPLVRVPAAPGDFSITRIEDQVYARFTVPSANVDGATPADVSRVEVYAITLEQPPFLADIDPEELREAASLVAAEQVRRAVLAPPAAPPKEGLPPIPVPPPAPGVDQGAVVVLREALTPETHTPSTLEARNTSTTEEIDVPRPLAAPPTGTSLQRYYFAVAVSPRGRYGPHSAVIPAPLAATSGAPSAPEIQVEENAMTLRWTPPADARGTAPPPDPELLPSRPIVPGPPPTTFDVYEVSRNASGEAPTAPPTPLTPEPIAATEFTESGITLGAERCFYVRSVDILDGTHVRGPASPVTCASFADTFVPAPPTDLVAVGLPGAINLIWEPSAATDVAGYVVLRGEAGSATLTPLFEQPQTTSSYRDDTVTAGTRYVYAVVAVDRAGNRSAESNRIEETAQ
jgi:hypothetical protein